MIESLESSPRLLDRPLEETPWQLLAASHVQQPSGQGVSDDRGQRRSPTSSGRGFVLLGITGACKEAEPQIGSIVSSTAAGDELGPESIRCWLVDPGLG